MGSVWLQGLRDGRFPARGIVYERTMHPGMFKFSQIAAIVMCCLGLLMLSVGIFTMWISLTDPAFVSQPRNKS
jgi:hypothetical protein